MKTDMQIIYQQNKYYEILHRDMFKSKIKIKKIEDSNIKKDKILEKLTSIEKKLNPTYLFSIKRNKTQENIWNFNGIYSRKLYTRLKNTFVKRALPQIP